jgi:hypothetical protein
MGACKRIVPERAAAKDHHDGRELDEAAGVESFNHARRSGRNRETVRALGAVGVDGDNMPADLVSPKSERWHSQNELLVVSGIADGRSGLYGPAVTGSELDTGEAWLDALAEG